MAPASVTLHHCRGLRINGARLLSTTHVTVQSADPGTDTRLAWPWPAQSAERHFDWFLGRLSTLITKEGVLGDLSAWTTWDRATGEPLTVHGWLSGVTLDIPKPERSRAGRATLTLTLRAFPEHSL